MLLEPRLRVGAAHRAIRVLSGAGRCRSVGPSVGMPWMAMGRAPPSGHPVVGPPVCPQGSTQGHGSRERLLASVASVACLVAVSAPVAPRTTENVDCRAARRPSCARERSPRSGGASWTTITAIRSRPGLPRALRPLRRGSHPHRPEKDRTPRPLQASSGEPATRLELTHRRSGPPSGHGRPCHPLDRDPGGRGLDRDEQPMGQATDRGGATVRLCLQDRKPTHLPHPNRRLVALLAAVPAADRRSRLGLGEG